AKILLHHRSVLLDVGLRKPLSALLDVFHALCGGGVWFNMARSGGLDRGAVILPAGQHLTSPGPVAGYGEGFLTQQGVSQASRYILTALPCPAAFPTPARNAPDT